MLTYVFDASAYLRFLDREAGGLRVAEIIEANIEGTARAVMSAVQWGEIVKIITNRQGMQTVATIARDLDDFGIEIVAATAARARQSALLGLKYKISYADAFGLELASDSPGHILVTVDFGSKPAEYDIRIEFLPVKSKP